MSGTYVAKLEVSLVPGGIDPCTVGFEFVGGKIYAIGNMEAVSWIGPGFPCDGTWFPTVNGQYQANWVCDGDEITVGITSTNCDCTLETIECVLPESMEVYLRTKLADNNKMEMSVEYNPKLKEIKKLKRVQEMRVKAEKMKKFDYIKKLSQRKLK